MTIIMMLKFTQSPWPSYITVHLYDILVINNQLRYHTVLYNYNSIHSPILNPRKIIDTMDHYNQKASLSVSTTYFGIAVDP